jgi:hypothetical protein
VGVVSDSGGTSHLALDEAKCASVASQHVHVTELHAYVDAREIGAVSRVGRWGGMNNYFDAGVR